ncbi:unnamed protein product [Phyllotreta striolata]|uniref:SCD domain-containing protein n=1 Tax=Phyllotreta striolata TaxID=444603 RepID=A0A9N9XQM7_PHYSR|nr:unnamed protein product [Phyllotreta striolata]
MESPRKRARTHKNPSTPGSCQSLQPANLYRSYENSEYSSSTSRSKSDESDISSEYTNYTQDYETFFESVRRVNAKGGIWKLYKPVDEDSLYHDILKQPQYTKQIAIDLLNNWENDPLNVIQSLVQLFVNLCGFKEFVAPEIYHIKNFQAYAEAIMNDLCEDESSDIIMCGRCLFNEKYEGTTQILRMGVYSFISNFIIIAFKKGILSPDNDRLTKCLQIILKVMSKQRLRQIMHTGIIISNKILSSLIMTYNLISNEFKFSPSDSNTEQALSENRNFLMLLINGYYLNFRNIYYSKFVQYATKLNQLKVECIRECKFWIKAHPRIFISNWEILKIINFYIHDACKDVRLAALHTLDEVFKCPEALQHITIEYMKDLIKIIKGRFDDVDRQVSIKALGVIQTIVLCHHELISQEVVDAFSKLIFCHSAPNGIEAAKLYTAYLKVSFNSTSASTRMSEDNYLLINIVNLYRKQQQANAKEYLIESFLRGCDDLLNWDSFYNLFYKIRDEDKTNILALSEIFAEFISQFLTGKTSVMRIRSEIYPPAEQNIHKKIVNLFENFRDLIQYHETPKISSELFRVVLLVDYDCPDTDNYSLMELERMFHAAFHSFKTCREPEMMYLNRATGVMAVLKSLDGVKRCADPILPNLIEETVASAKSYLINPVVEDSFLLLKLAALLKHFDLTNYFAVQELVVPFENLFDLHSIVGLTNSCAEYLKWQLKSAESITRSADEAQAISSLRFNCELVLDELFRLLKDDHLLTAIKSEVFFIICNFFTSFNAELNLIGTIRKKLFLILKLDITKDKSKQAILWYYVEKNVVFNLDMPIEERKKYLKSYVRLIEKKILSSECLINVLKLYSTHSEEYGEIVEWILSSFIEADSKNHRIGKTQDNNSVLLVLLTLFETYENILNVNGAVDFDSEEGNNLKALSQEFAFYKPLFQKRETIIDQFLDMVFFKNDLRLLPVIYLLEPFFKNIKEENTRNLFNKFGDFMKPYSKVDCIVWLKKLLKSK